jgi:large subunit ribosomal protein L21
MKYAIIENGGKQYKAVEGDTILVDLMDVEAGQQVPLESVLLLVEDDVVKVGAPLIKGASVKATVVGHEKGRKIEVFKYSPKKRIRVHTGHRQPYTRLMINTIEE